MMWTLCIGIAAAIAAIWSFNYALEMPVASGQPASILLLFSLACGFVTIFSIGVSVGMAVARLA